MDSLKKYTMTLAVVAAFFFWVWHAIDRFHAIAQRGPRVPAVQADMIPGPLHPEAR